MTNKKIINKKSRLKSQSSSFFSIIADATHIKVRSHWDVDGLSHGWRIGDNSSRRRKRTTMKKHRNSANFFFNSRNCRFDLRAICDVTLEIMSGAAIDCDGTGDTFGVWRLNVDANYDGFLVGELDRELATDSARWTDHHSDWKDERKFKIWTKKSNFELKKIKFWTFKIWT